LTSVTRGLFTHSDIAIPTPQVKALDKGKGSLVSHLWDWKEINALSAIVLDIYADCPNMRALTIREVEEI